jgi:pilus assembly protein CpaF
MVVRLYVTRKNQDAIVREFEQTIIRIGRQKNNDVVLLDELVSKHHAEIICEGSKMMVKDMGSTNGTMVNGHLIGVNKVIGAEDVVKLGNTSIRVEWEEEDVTEFLDRSSGMSHTEAISPAEGHLSREQEDHLFEQRMLIHDRLLETLNLKRMIIDGIDEEELRKRTNMALSEIIEDLDEILPEWVDRQKLHKDCMNEALGLGPLEELLEESSISEIMVNRPDQIYVERHGKLSQVQNRFLSDDHLRGTIERIVAPLGRRIDESSPMVDARLKDGSRVNAIIPPLALNGPCLTIRKFPETIFLGDDLIRFGSLTAEIVEFMRMCILQRRNIVISGGTGSGKTTLLNILSSFIPKEERIVTIEDSAELRLPQEHWVSLESRPPNIEGTGSITIRDLVRNSLRMRPDRIIVGECRGGEALDMLQAMNTGHDGSLTTVHANTTRDALSRIETMTLMAGMELPLDAIRRQISSAVNIVIQQSRMPDGTRKITRVTEITGMEKSIITTQDIFAFEQTGFDAQGNVEGFFTATGIVPRFVDIMNQRGEKVPMEIFVSRKE